MCPGLLTTFPHLTFIPYSYESELPRKQTVPKASHQEQLAKYEAIQKKRSDILDLGETLRTRGQEKGFDLDPNGERVMFAHKELDGFDGTYSGTTSYSEDGDLLSLSVHGKDSKGKPVKLGFEKLKTFSTYEDGEVRMLERKNGDLLVGCCFSTPG